MSTSDWAYTLVTALALEGCKHSSVAILQLRLCLVAVKCFSENIYFPEMLISRKGKYFSVFGCISKNFPENIFWCLEKKKENTNPVKYHQRSRSEIAFSPARSRDQRRELTTARDRELATARDRAVASSRLRSRSTARSRAVARSRSRAVDREIAPARSRS